MSKKFVFDFGRVVFSWQPERLLRELLPQRASDPASAEHWAAEFFQSYGGDWGEFDRGSVTPAELVARIAGRTGLSQAEVQSVVDGVPTELQPMADSVALLSRLRESGRELYFLSNMPAPYATHLETEHDFVGWFRDGVFSARVGLVKPESAIFELAASRFGAVPEELVFLDDHLPNIEAARAAGWAGGRRGRPVPPAPRRNAMRRVRRSPTRA